MCKPMIEQQTVQLQRAAADARQRAYAPYSLFRVGAAVLAADGRVLVGCNVENAAYGSTVCAERIALFRAVAEGEASGTFQALAVIADTDEPVAPCGECRQVMAELCPPDMPVILCNVAGHTRTVTVAELLPGSFSRASLKRQQSLDGGNHESQNL
jgi:cytidine deaminase